MKLKIPEFDIPIHTYDVHDWKSKKEKLLELSDRFESDYETRNDVNTTFFTRNEQLSKESFDILFYELSSVSLDQGFRFDLCNSHSWFQRYKKNENHATHNHGYGYLSCILFIKYNKKNHMPPVFFPYHFNFVTGSMITYEPENIKEGVLITFPSTLPHYVPMNHTKDLRMIMSMNLKIIVD